MGDRVNDKFSKTATDLNRHLADGALDASWLPPEYFTWMEIKGWYTQRKKIVGEFKPKSYERAGTSGAASGEGQDVNPSAQWINYDFLVEKFQGHGGAVPTWNNDSLELKRRASEEGGQVSKKTSISKMSLGEVNSPLPKSLQGKTPPAQPAATPQPPPMSRALKNILKNSNTKQEEREKSNAL